MQAFDVEPFVTAALDWQRPDYGPVFVARMKRLAYLREHPEELALLKLFYAEYPAHFINDWGITVDPRNAEIDVPVMVPFLLFPKQAQWIDWVLGRWKERRPGLTEKSRDAGVSWLACALAATLCLFRKDLTIGFGSRKEEYVDKIGHPKSLFWKVRQFIEHLPPEFTGGWNSRQCSAHMRISFPVSGSVITGEAGDNIGRGDRASIYFVDEAAYLERPQLIEASLSQTTNCRIDISSANGTTNPFYEKRAAGRISVFTFHWRDDPRKDDAWYAKQCEELDAVTVAQEIDINYTASVTGVVIPQEWVQACVDAHIKLGIIPKGGKRGAYDVADEGKDNNAFVVADGIVVTHAEEWSGKGSDITASTQKVFGLCDDHAVFEFKFDSDGLGADVRGAARVLNEKRVAARRSPILAQPFRGSSEVHRPDAEDVPGRKNKDFFRNRKAQSWWALRRRCYATYRAVVHGDAYDPAELISFDAAALKAPSPGAPYGTLSRILIELSQPTYKKNEIGQIVIDKAPDGSRSPNLGDGVMILFGHGARTAMVISDDALQGI